MLEELKREVCGANPELPRRGPVTCTWGSVSGIDRSAANMEALPRMGHDDRRSAPQYMIAISIITENTAPEPITGRSDARERIAAGCYQ